MTMYSANGKEVNPIEVESTKTGVYMIRNEMNGKCYVGSAAISFKDRWSWHLRDLRGSKHHSTYLQNAWCVYGSKSFAFYVLEVCIPLECITREQIWLDFYEVANRTYGYNLSPTAGSPLGYKQTAETCAKISEVNKKRWKNPEFCTKMSAILKGRKVSDETRKKMSLALKGRKLSAEHCAATSAGQRGKKLSAEHKAKLSAAHKGKKLSEESKAKMSASRKGIQKSSEWRKALSDSSLGKKMSEESKAKMSASRKGKKLNLSVEAREKLSTSRKGKKVSPETCAKISAVKKGKPLSEKNLIALREAGKRKIEYLRWLREQSKDETKSY